MVELPFGRTDHYDPIAPEQIRHVYECNELALVVRLDSTRSLARPLDRQELRNRLRGVIPWYQRQIARKVGRTIVFHVDVSIFFFYATTNPNDRTYHLSLPLSGWIDRPRAHEIPVARMVIPYFIDVLPEDVDVVRTVANSQRPRKWINTRTNSWPSRSVLAEHEEG